MNVINYKKVKELYDISRITLINWEKEGLITPVRTPKVRRSYKKRRYREVIRHAGRKTKT